MKAAIYVRVSTGMQDEGLQRDELRALAIQRGYKVVQEHVDTASGMAQERAGLEALRQGARRGQFQIVLIWKLDRLGRSLPHLLGVLDELTREGVQLVALRDPIDTTSAHGRLLTQLLGVFASFERDLIRERCMAGQARARAAGKPIGRPAAVVDSEAATRLLTTELNVRRTARLLKISEATLRRRILQEAGKGT